MKNEKITYKDLGIVSYQEGLQLQTTCFEELISAKQRGEHKTNQLLFCEHTPVLTLGKSGKENNLLISRELLQQKGIDFFEVNRGGDITYHGPGQITGYPIIDLEEWGIGLKQYVSLLEDIIIRFLSTYNVTASRLPSATGVWIEAHHPRKTRKICAIGVKSSRYVTMHGFALNVNTDLSYFDLINPCGFIDKGVTSLQKELQTPVNMEEAKIQLATLFLDTFKQL